MKRMLLPQIFFCIILLGLMQLWASGNTLAVLDFENNSLFQPDEYQPLAKGLSEIMITELDQVEAIDVVERQKLKSVVDELKLSQSGLVSEKGSIEVGKMLGAQYLVFGSYMVALDKKIRIDARIVSVETGLTVKASQVTGKEENLLSLISKLSKKILEDLDVRLTKTEENLFSESQNFEMESVVLFSKGLELEDQGLWEEAEQCYQKVVEIEPKFIKAIDRLEQLSNMIDRQ